MVAIKPAQQTDANWMRQVEQKCFTSEDAYSIQQIKNLIKSKSSITEIIYNEDTPVGWACWTTRSNSKSVRLYTIGILPEHSGNGYGTQYLEFKLKQFEQLGYKRAVLEVREKSRAVKFYHEQAFITDDYLLDYYGENQHGLRMYKNL